MCVPDGVPGGADCWVGSDVAVPGKLRVMEASRAEREGRALRAREQAAEEALLGSEEEDEPEEGEEDEEGEGGRSPMIRRLLASLGWSFCWS